MATSGITPPWPLLDQLGGFETLKLDQSWWNWAIIWVQFSNVVSVCAASAHMACGFDLCGHSLPMEELHGENEGRSRPAGVEGWVGPQLETVHTERRVSPEVQDAVKNRIYPGGGKTLAATPRTLGLLSLRPGWNSDLSVSEARRYAWEEIDLGWTPAGCGTSNSIRYHQLSVEPGPQYLGDRNC